jgi:hypothetical protein
MTCTMRMWCLLPVSSKETNGLRRRKKGAKAVVDLCVVDQAVALSHLALSRVEEMYAT